MDPINNIAAKYRFRVKEDDSLEGPTPQPKPAPKKSPVPPQGTAGTEAAGPGELKPQTEEKGIDFKFTSKSKSDAQKKLADLDSKLKAAQTREDGSKSHGPIMAEAMGKDKVKKKEAQKFYEGLKSEATKEIAAPDDFPDDGGKEFTKEEASKEAVRGMKEGLGTEGKTKTSDRSLKDIETDLGKARAELSYHEKTRRGEGSPEYHEARKKVRVLEAEAVSAKTKKVLEDAKKYYAPMGKDGEKAFKEAMKSGIIKGGTTKDIMKTFVQKLKEFGTEFNHNRWMSMRRGLAHSIGNALYTYRINSGQKIVNEMRDTYGDLSEDDEKHLRKLVGHAIGAFGYKKAKELAHKFAQAKDIDKGSEQDIKDFVYGHEQQRR